MKTIFITATNTDIGKTYCAEQLLKKFAQLNYRVGYFKPFETGVENIAPDGNKLLKLTKKLNKDFTFDIDDIVPYQFKLPASIYVANENSKDIDFQFLKSKIENFKQSCDILIIEGAGGLLVPIDKNYFLIDIIKLLNIDKTILVTPSKLGAINDTLLSMEALKYRDINFSWLINLYLDEESFNKITMPYYKDKFKNLYILQQNLDFFIKRELNIDDI